jgi:hypothetical protein
MRRMFALIVFLLGLCVPLFGLDREDLLFYASLDGTVKADYARGEPEPTSSPEVEFAKGIRGKGVIASGYLTWKGEANARGEEGTISFWLSPVDYSAPDGKNHNFMFMSAEGGVVYLYMFYPGNAGMIIQQQGKTVGTCWNYYKFEKGKFYQMTFTWRPDEWKLYMDGRLVQHKTEDIIPLKKVNSFFFAGGPTVFDELIVLGRAVTDEEALGLYKRVKNPEKQKPQ